MWIVRVCSVLVLMVMTCPYALTAEDTVCTDWPTIEAHANQKAHVRGTLRPFTPVKSGKGQGVMFWDWELALTDGTAIPIKNGTLSAKIIRRYQGQTVTFVGRIFHGIVIGSSKPPYAQSAAGYRLDVMRVVE